MNKPAHVLDFLINMETLRQWLESAKSGLNNTNTRRKPNRDVSLERERWHAAIHLMITLPPESGGITNKYPDWFGILNFKTFCSHFNVICWLHKVSMICAILSVVIQFSLLNCCSYQGPEGKFWPFYKKPCTMFNYTPGKLFIDMVKGHTNLPLIKEMRSTAHVTPAGQERVTALTAASASRGSGQS